VRHDDEPVGHGQGLILVVSDHHGGDAESTLELTDLDADFLPELAVEVRQGLVQEQHLGGDDDRSSRTSRRASATRRRRSAGATRRVSSPKAMFSTAVRCGKSA